MAKRVMSYRQKTEEKAFKPVQAPQNMGGRRGGKVRCLVPRLGVPSLGLKYDMQLVLQQGRVPLFSVFIGSGKGCASDRFILSCALLASHVLPIHRSCSRSIVRWGDSGSTLAFCKTYKRWATAAQRVFADQLRKGHASAPNSKMEPTLTERLESEPGINGVADDVRARPMAPLAGQEDPTIIPEHIATVTPDKMRNVLPREKRPALPPQGLFDFILAGDVLYKQTLLEPFLGTVEEMLAPNGRLLLCHVPRAGVTYDIVEDAFTRNRLAFTVVDGSKDKMEINGGRDDVGGVELCMDDARRARLYSVTRKS